MMTRDEVLKCFRKCHALQRGHFELSSGLHSGHYFQCAQLLQYPRITSRVCKDLAEYFASTKPTVVVGPATGGIVVAYEVARKLGCRAIYTERIDSEMHLRRGFKVTKEDRVLLVEDAISTGESARKVAALLECFGAKIVGIGTLVDRSGGKVKFPKKKFKSLLTIAFEAFAPDDCPLCGEEIPTTRPGRPKHELLDCD